MVKDKASYLGTVPLDFLHLPGTVAPWQTYETEDIFMTNFINYPKEYLYTVGSGINPTYQTTYASLATTPSYPLPTQSQLYIAGRDVIRWGGEKDPLEIDFDRYGFTPDFNKGVAIVWKAPKSEPHHLSTTPELLKTVPTNLQELIKTIVKGKFK